MNYLVQIIESDHTTLYKLSYEDAKDLLKFKDSGDRWKHFGKVAKVALVDKEYFAKPDLYWNISWECTDVDLEEWKRVINKVVKL